MRTQKHRYYIHWEERLVTFIQKNILDENNDVVKTIELGSCKNLMTGVTPLHGVDEDEVITRWERMHPHARIVNIT